MQTTPQDLWSIDTTTGISKVCKGYIVGAGAG